MLYYTKEFLASAEDDHSSHNPYVLTKLNLKTIENFNFEEFQKLLERSNANSQNGLALDDFSQRKNFNFHHAYRFFPKLRARA